MDDQQLTLIGQQRTMTTSPYTPVSGSMTSKLFLTYCGGLSFITSTCVTCFLSSTQFTGCHACMFWWSGARGWTQRIHQQIRFMGI